MSNTLKALTNLGFKKTCLIDKDGKVTDWLGHTPVNPEKLAAEILKVEAEEQILLQVGVKEDYLNKTDHKDLPNYEPKEDEDVALIIMARSEAREFIRNNRVN